MKRLQSKGLGSNKRQAEPLSQQEEEILWQKALLGDITPQTLLDTMIFCNGLYFALRSGREHRQLWLRPCQIQLKESDLQYTEDVSKNRPGGIKGRKVKPKIVLHHSNTDNPERCFVRLFKKYIQLCPDTPTEMSAFYLQPAAKPTIDCWYTSKPLGHNTLTKLLSRMCKAAGIEGFKTNHSLRATTATRLYQSGVDEQLVMERTGHRSLEGVRSYKRTSDGQREVPSDILNNKMSKSCTSEVVTVPHPVVANSLPQNQEHSSTQLAICGSDVSLQNKEVVVHTSNQQEQCSSTQLAPSSSTNIQTNTKNSLPGTFVLNSCTAITINIEIWLDIGLTSELDYIVVLCLLSLVNSLYVCSSRILISGPCCEL